LLKYQVKNHGLEAILSLADTQIEIEAPEQVKEVLERLILDGYKFGGGSASMEASPSDFAEYIHHLREDGLDIDLLEGTEPSDFFDENLVA
jgi:hypothetical protein